MDIFVWQESDRDTIPHNINFTLIGIIDSFNSMIWTERYSEHGDFELYLQYTEEVSKLLRPGNFLSINDSNQYMLIESINEKIVGSSTYLTVTGRTLTCILEKRLHLGTTVFNDEGDPSWYRGKNVHAIANFILDINITNCRNYITSASQGSIWTEGANEYIKRYLQKAALYREIPNYKIVPADDNNDPNHRIRTKMPKNVNIENQSVYEVIKSLCDRYGFGIKTIYQNGKINFYLYDGKFNNSVIFSPEFDNISDISYTDDNKTKTSIIVAKGERDSDDNILQIYEIMDEKKWVWSEEHAVYPTYHLDDGIRLNETFVDLTSVKEEKKDVYGNTIPNTYATYVDRLKDEAFKTLRKNNKASFILECTMTNPRDYKIGEDYDLGDVVNVSYKNAYSQMRVSEIIRSYDGNGYRVYPSFTAYEELNDDDDE